MKPKPEDPAQHKRFIDMAREVEVDEREGAFDRAFERISDKAKSPIPSDRRSRRNEKPASS
jgi:hypothetical protein